jgi:hypothetical protein
MGEWDMMLASHNGGTDGILKTEITGGTKKPGNMVKTSATTGIERDVPSGYD